MDLLPYLNIHDAAFSFDKFVKSSNTVILAINEMASNVNIATINFVNDLIDGLAANTYVNDTFATIAYAAANTYVNDELALKASLTLTATKADNTYVNSSLSALADSVTSALSGKQNLATILTSLTDLASNGIVTRTASGVITARSLVMSGAGISITNPEGTSGNFTLGLVNDLAALEALGSTGIAVRTATDTWAQRTLVTTGQGITITNPGGVAGNINIALAGGKQTIFIPAKSMVSLVTNGPFVGVVELATNKVIVASLDFDTITQETAQFEFAMPKSWNAGTISFRVHWTAASGSGGVAWGLKALARGDNEALDNGFGTTVVATDTFQNANRNHIAAESGAVTILGAGAQKLIIAQILRQVAHASDTLNADAKLLGVEVYYTTNVGHDN